VNKACLPGQVYNFNRDKWWFARWEGGEWKKTQLCFSPFPEKKNLSRRFARPFVCLWRTVKQCAVLNISPGGVCVVCDEAFDVECDDVCGGWELKLGNIQLYNLSARVIHVSSMASGRFVCGIQWIDLEETQKVAIDGAVACMKAQVLGNNDRNISPHTRFLKHD
jgi:hypothetical protein